MILIRSSELADSVLVALATGKRAEIGSETRANIRKTRANIRKTRAKPKNVTNVPVFPIGSSFSHRSSPYLEAFGAQVIDFS